MNFTNLKQTKSDSSLNWTELELGSTSASACFHILSKQYYLGNYWILSLSSGCKIWILSSSSVYSELARNKIKQSCQAQSKAQSSWADIAITIHPFTQVSISTISCIIYQVSYIKYQPSYIKYQISSNIRYKTSWGRAGPSSAQIGTGTGFI